MRQRDFKSSRFDGSSEDVVFKGFSFTLSSAKRKNLFKCTKFVKEFCIITAKLQMHQFEYYEPLISKFSAIISQRVGVLLESTLVKRGSTAMLTAKRSAGVAQEGNLRNPLYASERLTLALKTRPVLTRGSSCPTKKDQRDDAHPEKLLLLLSFSLNVITIMKTGV